jgi:hypothetical protein
MEKTGAGAGCKGSGERQALKSRPLSTPWLDWLWDWVQGLRSVQREKDAGMVIPASR